MALHIANRIAFQACAASPPGKARGCSDFGHVTHELYYGAYRSRRASRNIAVVDALRFPVLEFDREDARKAGEIRAYLASTGAPIGPCDVLIAGQSIARNLILVTHDTGEFGRVPGLWKYRPRDKDAHGPALSADRAL